MPMGMDPDAKPLGKVVTRKQYVCPECRGVIPEIYIEALQSMQIRCPNCMAYIQTPKIEVSSTSAANERQERRCPVTLKVRYKGAHEFKTAYTKNVSRGGMFIKTSGHLEIGESVILELYVPDLKEPVRLTGEIVHVRAFADASSDVSEDAGVGVKFIDIDAVSKAALLNYLGTRSDCD